MNNAIEQRFGLDSHLELYDDTLGKHIYDVKRVYLRIDKM